MICLALVPRWAPAQTQAAAAAASATGIPFRKDDRDVASGLPTTIGILVVLALLGWGGVHALRRSRLAPRVFAGKVGRVRLIEAVRIDPRVTLYLVAADDRTLLLGRCGDKLVVASELRRAPASGDPAEGGR
jgi:hypothetical protein